MHHIAVFASGNGTNAQRIMDHFAGSDLARVSLVLCNNPEAFVLERSRRAGVPYIVFNRKELNEKEGVLEMLRQKNISFIVLAGFLWLLPPGILSAFPGRVVNIHPALLPKYGGKGMYGMKVHEAVLLAGDKESGITVHYVNEKYDDGHIIFQARCPVLPGDTPETLAERIHLLEYKHFPEVVEKLLTAL
jgi:phosphoribosylglycinamide formyltransferase-1